MERNGFTTPGFESNTSSSEDVSEKPKSKKKKSAESAPVAAEAKKKEEVADKGKSLWEKLVGDDKEKSAKKSEKKVENESGDSKEDAVENDPALEKLTPEEEVEVTRRLVIDQLDELEAGRTAEELPADAEAREAAIVMLQEMLDEMPEATVETEEDESEPIETESIDNETGVAEQEQDEPIELDDTEPVLLKSGSGGRRTPPPATPASSSPSPTHSTQGSTFQATNFNTAPSAASSEYDPDYQTNPNTTYLLVGGVVGYLVGRRRGRIKTEKRMKVVQQKLEKQVEAKEQEIIVKTEAVKRLAREKYEEKHRHSARERAQAEANPTSVTKSEQSIYPEVAPEVLLAAVTAERADSETVTDEKKPTLERPETPEKSEKPKTVEHSEKTPQTAELEDSDILKISEEITVGATNLRKVYEARLVTRAGLRRLVSEHLQGKDIRRGLAREFLAKELSYERDPRFRDLLPPEESKTRKSSGKSQDPAVPVELFSESAPKSTSNSKQASSLAQTRKQTSSQKTISTGVLTLLSLVALGLAAYAVILTLTR